MISLLLVLIPYIPYIHSTIPYIHSIIPPIHSIITLLIYSSIYILIDHCILIEIAYHILWPPYLPNIAI